VTLNSITTHHCRRALNVTLVEQYDIKSNKSCELAPAIEPGSTFLLTSENSNCTDNCLEALSLEIGEDYFVAAHHRSAVQHRGCGDGSLWDITKKPVIAKWDGLNNKDKIATFVNKGNCDRKCC